MPVVAAVSARLHREPSSQLLAALRGNAVKGGCLQMSEQPATFGAELRRRRTAAGLSLAEFAKRVHYSKGYLGKIETGEKPPGADLARRCDAVLDAGGHLVALVPVEPPSPSPNAETDQDGEVWVMSMEPDGTSR